MGGLCWDGHIYLANEEGRVNETAFYLITITNTGNNLVHRIFDDGLSSAGPVYQMHM